MPTHFLSPNIFPNNIFWNTEGLLYEMLRYCEMKQFRHTLVTTAPFLILIIFRFQKDLEHRKFPLRKVSVLWDQKSRRRIVMPTPFFIQKKHFSISKNFWSTIGFLYEMFRYCETSAERRNFSGESWYTSPSYAQKLSVLKIFVKLKRVPLRSASVLWAKNTDEDPDAHPFLVLNVFRYRKFSETQKGSLTKSFGTVKQNSFTENPDTPTPLCMKNFWTRFFWNDEGFPTKRLDTVRQKNFRTIVMPTHFLFPNLFPKKNFRNTEGLLYEMFRYCEMKPFRRTIVTTAHFLILIMFRFQKDLEHRKVPLRKVSVLWDQKSRRRIVMPPHFLFPNIFPKNNFWNTEGLLYEMLRYCEMKPFRRTIVTTTPFLILIIFRFQKDLEHRKVPLRKPPVLWDQKSRGRIVMPTHFLYLNIFQYQKLSDTQKGSSTKCIATGKQTFSKHSRDPASLSFFNTFSIWKIIWNTEGFLDELFWYCETK